MADHVVIFDRAEAADPVIKLDPIAMGYNFPDDVPDDCKPSLRSLLKEVKTCLRSGVDVTDDEFDKFMEIIFEGWATRDNDIEPPTSPSTKTGLGDIAYKIRVLAEACVASTKETGVAKSRERGRRTRARRPQRPTDRLASLYIWPLTTRRTRISVSPSEIAVESS